MESISRKDSAPTGRSTSPTSTTQDHSGCYGAPPAKTTESPTVLSAAEKYNAKFNAAIAIVRDGLEAQGWMVEVRGSQLILHDSLGEYCATAMVSYDLREVN